jgi:hypothetical protein
MEMKIRSIKKGEKFIFRRQSESYCYSGGIINGGIVEAISELRGTGKSSVVDIRFTNGLEQTALIEDLHEILNKRIVMRL